MLTKIYGLDAPSNVCTVMGGLNDEINRAAKELDIDPGLLYYHIKKDPDLHNVYHMMRYRRGYVAKNNSAKIWEMLDQGYSKTVIAATVGVSPNQVKYQQARRQKMGLA